MEDNKKLMHLIFIIAKLIIEDRFSFMDDHREGHSDTAPALVLYRNELCPLWHGSACSINPLYLGVDGLVHVTKSSIGVIKNTWDIPISIELWNKIPGNSPMQLLYHVD